MKLLTILRVLCTLCGSLNRCTGDNRPTKLVFEVDIPNTPRTCAVIADVTPQEHGVEDGIVNSVTVRRDIRLE